MKRRLFVSGVVATTLSAANIVRAREVTYELILALDYSGSMFNNRNKNVGIQQAGHVDALKSEWVRRALIPYQPIITCVQWAERTRQIFSTRVKGVKDLDEVAERIADIPQTKTLGRSTSHLSLLRSISDAPRVTPLRVLDISTDERPSLNEVLLCYFVKKALEFHALTRINVLAIGIEENALETMKKSVITSDGFLHHIGSFDDYSSGIERKLTLDLA